MAFKFFRWLAGDEPQEVRELPVVKRTHRIGMDKNFRIGKIKRVSDDRSKILVDVLEMCNGSDSDVYEAHYNLWLHFDKEWKGVVSKDLTGQWVVVGFYIQSFRDKDYSDKFDTVNTCRFLNVVPSEREARSLAIDLMESRLFVDHYYLKLSNIKIK
jgi:hypothetical protein